MAGESEAGSDGKPAGVAAAVTHRPAPTLSARTAASRPQPVAALWGWEKFRDSSVEAVGVKLSAFSMPAGTSLFSGSTGQRKLICSKDVLCGRLVCTHWYTQ